MHKLVSVRHRREDECPNGARGGARAGSQVRGSLKADVSGTVLLNTIRHCFRLLSAYSFGASHDGSQNAELCSATDLNLMASKMSRVTDPTKARNPWTFSACSLHSIYEYVDKLTRYPQNAYQCMKR